MVKIETITTYAPSRFRRAAKSGSPSAFTVSGSEGEEARASVMSAPQSSAEMASLSQLMQIQEIGERDASAKRTVVQGEMILESLEKLQNEILAGAISKRSLEHIVTMTTALPAQISNPNLKQVIAEIKQRAMVEIAKIEMSR
ncbi:MAG: hypothetical protein GW748_02785 [Alphaproteobacteria bacterium]|nr:hypothetical protein [Alphaproteobacteria bacterium]NCQ66653.1 hypothetical protein [Alphaproteobacteria bacterium]NCT07005.1 hypothetical protein [Alphaproteobacteria bacterium]